MTPLTQLFVLLSTPAAPFVLALALLLKRDSSWLNSLAVAAPLPALAVAVLMPPGIATTVPWLLQGSEFGLDLTGRVFLLFTAVIWLAAGLYARQAVPREQRTRFFVYFLFVMSGNLGLILARDMLAFYFFFVLMSFAAYGLIVHERSAGNLLAGRVYMTLVVAADMALFAALALAALETEGTLLFEAVRESIFELEYAHAVILLLVLGFGVKVGVLGLHVALPVIYRAAPPPGAAVLAGALISAGVLAWLRYLPIGADWQGWAVAMIAAGIAAAFYGVLAGLPQRSAAAVLAYSSISQLGIITAGVGAAMGSPDYAGGIVAAVIVYAMHHAFAKAALFLGTGVAAAAPAASRSRKLVVASLLLPAFALTGAPLTSGMLAKEYLKESLYQIPDPWVAALVQVLPWMAFATTLIMVRFMWVIAFRANTSPLGADVRAHAGEAHIDASGRGASRRGAAMFAAFGLLWLATATGVWLIPIEDPPALWSPPVWWDLTWPIALGAGAAWAVEHAIAAGRLPPAPAVPPGDLLWPALRLSAQAAVRWRSFSGDWLPGARDGWLDRVRSARRSPIWSRAAAGTEEVLGEWAVGLAMLIAAIVVLAAVALWP